MTIAVVSCSSSSVWHGYKDLEQNVLSNSVSLLPRIVDKYRRNLVEPLKNSPRSVSNRAIIEKGLKEPIDTDEGPKLLTQSLIDETLIISAIYNLDEIKTLELLWAAENHLPQYPGLTRGLVAILLYWDGRLSLVNALHHILCQNASLTQIGNIIQVLYDEQILKNLVSSYSALSIEGELDKLAAQRGLGDPRHRRDLRELITSTKLTISTCIFLLSYQDNYFKPQIVLDELKKIELTGEGILAEADFVLVASLISFITIDLKDDYDSISEIPILSDPVQLDRIHDTILNGEFKSKEVSSLLKLVWSVTLRSLSQLPSLSPSTAEIMEQDDLCLEKALQDNVFHFITKLIENDVIQDDALVNICHKLITGLIIMMPLKMKELRKSPDGKNFLSIMETISKFYSKYSETNLHEEFWNAELTHKATHRELALHDFLRIDIVPPHLYTATVLMIKSLSTGENCSKACFKLMRQATGNISWERIFDSLKRYCEGLMAEIGQNSSLTGMSPQESEAMIQVIDLIGVVAANDSSARQVILEQQSWRAPLYLMQLLRCPVEPGLKAAAIRSLTALIGSAESSSSLWVSIESDNLLQGLIQELQVTESQLEKYPLTISFCKLMKHLFSFPLPLTLGTGSRAKPGLDPYIEYMLNEVLIKLSVRSYKDPSEKYEISKIIFDILQFLMKDYVPNPEYFTFNPNQGGMHPGHHIYRFLMTDSTFLRHLLAIIEETVGHLERFPMKPDKQLLESGNGALELICLGLNGSDDYLNACRDAGAGLLLTPTHQLLRSINKKTDKADHVLNITKFIRHANRHINLAASSLKILRFLSLRISPKEFLELTLSSETSQRDELLRGFWELLELSGDETIQCRIELLKLLLQGVDSPTVSITHYLLGYPLQASLSKASLQDPGILNSPKTVLHSLLGILSNKEIRQENAALIQYGYELIYKICSNSETSGPALRYLRSSNDFVYRQLADLDIPAIADTLYFKTYGWLLKLVALELHITTQAKQRSNQLRLITLLFKRSGAVSETFTNSMVQEMTLLNGENVSSMLIIDIFRLIDMSQAFPDPPRTDLLDMNVVQLLASKCTKDNIVDLIRLHQLMKIELAPQVEGAGSLEELENEVEQVLRWIQKSNGENELIQSKVLFLNGWRQLIEICLSGPVELLQSDQRTQLLQEIFDVMLKEIRKPSSSTTLTSTLSTVGLSIMTNLRISIKQQEDPQKSTLNLLDGSMVETITSKILPTNSIVPSIGEGIIEWAVSSKNQKVRAHLYAALLNFINLQPDFYGSREADLSTTRSLFETLNESEMNLTIGSLSAGSSTKILNKYGTSIMSVTCQDAIDGHHVTRTLAFTLLDAIMRRDGDRKWLNFMKEKGYLKHILASIELEDASLIQSLTGSSAYAFVYVHESRMAMLNTLARTRQGARALLENGLLNKLSSAKFIHSRPIIQVSSSDDDDKSRQHRYRMLIFPVLRLINTLQSSLSDRILNLQILQFVITHQDALLTPLGTTYSEPSKDLEELEEVHLITSVLCLIAAHDFSSVKGDGDVGLPDSSVRGFEIHQNKIKRILFAALPIYILSEKWIKSVSNEAYLEAQRISTNLTQTARQLMLNAIYKNETNVIFSLKLSDEAAHGAEDPPLGIMLSILKTTSQNFGLAIQDQISIKHKLENIEGLPTLELDFLSTDGQDGSTVEPTERPNLHQKQQIAKNALEKKYKVQQKLLYVQHQQLESVLFIIWRHVQYYLTTAPAKPRGILFGGDDDSTVREHSMSAADLSNFKSALRTKMNDSLLKRINDVEAQFMKIDDGDTLKQFIQPLTYRLSKTIELNQK